MLENGFVKLHRSLLKWEWYDNANTMRLFIHLILTANIEDVQWREETIKRGSRVTSRRVLASELKISEREIRTAISHLESTGEVTSTTTNKYTIITVSNYEKFQQMTNKTASNRPSSDQQPTSNRPQYKKDKKDKKEKEDRGASPTLSILQSFISENRLNVDAEKFFAYYERFHWRDKNGRPVDWRDKLKSWDARELKSKPVYQNGYAGIRNLADDD